MPATPSSQLVIVVDFGAQYGQLIARRVRDLHVYSEIVPCDVTASEVAALAPAAIILSGGPASVYAEDAPSVDPGIFELGIPVLGFCYGQQIMAVTLGGTVGHTDAGEYGAASLTRRDEGASALYGETPVEQTVWMSHRGDGLDRHVSRGFDGVRRAPLVRDAVPPRGAPYAARRRAFAQLPVRHLRPRGQLDDGLHHRRRRGGHPRAGGR